MARATQTTTTTTTNIKFSLTNPFSQSTPSASKQVSSETTSTGQRRCPVCGKYMRGRGRR